MSIEESREDLRSGRDVMSSLPIESARREVVNLGSSNLVASVRGLLSLLAINTRQIDESIWRQLDVIAEGGHYTKSCIDTVIGEDPEYPGFSKAGQAAGAVHESGKRSLEHAAGMKVNYAHAQIHLERALSSLEEATRRQDAISSEITTASQKQLEALSSIRILDPGL